MGEGRDPDAVEPDIDNTISGGNFNGPVGQFGFVHGDVHLNPPRSPEEAAFRARYMKKMQEEWDAQEKAKRDAENKPAVGGVRNSLRHRVHRDLRLPGLECLESLRQFPSREAVELRLHGERRPSAGVSVVNVKHTAFGH
ncbi:hypothetical protein [Saccharopolyspora sp. NPDC050642]|uniref:hypothetical protein n=1 Tax=Saccharopolyspora sp. NPDC050642 TaxID=3157099 RepID=UPI0033E5AB58